MTSIASLPQSRITTRPAHTVHLVESSALPQDIPRVYLGNRNTASYPTAPLPAPRSEKSEEAIGDPRFDRYAGLREDRDGSIGLTGQQPKAPTSHIRAHAQAQAQAQLQANAIRHAQLQQQLAHIQKHQLLQNILTGQPGAGSAEPHLRSPQQQSHLQAQQSSQYYNELIQAQAQAQHAIFAAQMQGLFDPRQAQYIHQLQLQQQHQAQIACEHRHALAAQVQANLQGRIARTRNASPDDADLRARFEGVTLGQDAYTTPVNDAQAIFENPLSPGAGEEKQMTVTAVNLRTLSETPSTTKPSPLGRIAQPSTNKAVAGNNLTILSRRRVTDESTVSSSSETNPNTNKPEPNSTSYNTEDIKKSQKASTVQTIGHGRPGQANTPTGRVWSTPNQPSARLVELTPRSASFAGQTQKSIVTRQPVGPPGEPKELGEKNFQTRIRRQAGLKLGMLGRRIESPAPTPVLA